MRKLLYRRREKNLTQRRKEGSLKKTLRGRDFLLNALVTISFSSYNLHCTGKLCFIYNYISNHVNNLYQETYDKNEGSDIKRIVYVKVHATKQCLFEYAEHLQVKKLLKVSKYAFIIIISSLWVLDVSPSSTIYSLYALYNRYVLCNVSFVCCLWVLHNLFSMCS